MSDIWSEFEKIALEQGLVTEAEEEERDLSKMPARYDSLSDDAIRLLYNVEPETIFEKGKSIIDVAHPETAIVGRAYDAMNAVIENEHQRHDMMAYIALKMPNGHLTQRRYVAARQELVNSLVRSAFVLDHQEEHELMSLADSCTARLVNGDNKKKELTKEAVTGAEVAVVALPVAATAALLGAGYYVFYGATTATNVYQNSQKVLQALERLSDQPYAEGIRQNVTQIMEMARQVYELKDSLTGVQSVDVAESAVKDPKYQKLVQEADKRIKNYLAQLRKVQAAIPQWVAKIKMTHETSTKEQSDWWAKLQGVADPFFWSADETLIDRLAGQKNWLSSGSTGGLYEAISKDIQLMSQAIRTAQQQVEQKFQMESLPTQPAPTTPAPQMPMAQNTPAPQLPTPTPAPPPTPPAGAARKPPEGFGGLPQW